MKKILIIGCGELGSRFLQAAVSLNEITCIDIVEPGLQARETAQKRMEEVGRDLSTLTVNWFSDLSEQLTPGDMAVIATQSDVRLSVFEKAISLGYRYFLVEKIVTQSNRDYLRMLDLAQQNGAKVWVNCKTRNYPVWEYIKSKIDPSEKLIYHSVGGNHGICTNGLHTIDLFVFLAGEGSLTILETRFDKELQLTKRGKYDISGQLQVENNKNKSLLVLNYEAGHNQMPIDLLFSGKYRWIVDNSTRQAFESFADGERKLLPIPFDGDVTVSGMAKLFIKDILENHRCALPTLEDCYPAHKAMFDATLPLFNEQLHKQDDICPAT